MVASRPGMYSVPLLSTRASHTVSINYLLTLMTLHVPTLPNLVLSRKVRVGPLSANPLFSDSFMSLRWPSCWFLLLDQVVVKPSGL